MRLIENPGLHVVDTHRKYPRSVAEAWPMDYRPSAIGIEGPPVIRTYIPWWERTLNLALNLFKRNS